MYNDYYLKAASQAAWDAILTGCNVSGLTLDVIGTIYEGGAWDENAVEVTPPTAVPGWHVNVRSKSGLPVAMQGIEIPAPEFPKRVFA